MFHFPKIKTGGCIGKSACLSVVILSTLQLWSGGVRYVGGSAFDPAARGKPLTWLNGQLTYFTDQGSLGPLLDQTSANSFVADALSRWTSVSTAALTATRGGSLSEDVNGGNVSGGLLPVDIQPTATNKPIAVVFDNDGQVTDALLGSGASDPSLCSTNSVMGGVDNFTTAGNLAHALIIINGRCAQTSTNLMALKYRLVRKFGEVLGIGWSQLNDNVRTGVPIPTEDDFAGFPVMDADDLLCLVPAGLNCANASTLRMDDRAAISRLYPVTLENLSRFPGKQTFSSHTIRVRGSVYFSDVHGGRGQPMQGVNVVARLIDRVTGLPSGKTVSSAVSGFLFRGDAGNSVSGFAPPGGQRFDAFGSADPLLEGSYDLAGLELPGDVGTVDYQISLEAVNALHTGEASVGPYRIGPVIPSPDISNATVTLSGLNAGMEVVHNFILAGSARIVVDANEPSSFMMASAIPSSGEWWGSLSPYGDADFFLLPAHANRSFYFDVTALNEGYLPTSAKLQPMLGLWLASDQAGSAPKLSQTSFNTANVGLTRMGVNIFQDGPLKLGIADIRGDGRPDFIYHARLLYADRLTPTRIVGAGIPIVINGIGFRKGMTVTIGGVPSSILSVAENEIVATSPSLPDGEKNLVISDSQAGTATTMTNALEYGLASGSQLLLVAGSNPATPVGADAPNPIRVRVVGPDGVTGVSAIPITLSASPASLLSPCGSSSCTVQTDGTGEVAATVTVKFAGTNTISASLGDGQKVQATILGTSGGLTLSAIDPLRFVPSGNSASLLLTAKALNGGLPVGLQRVNYFLTTGAGSLSSSSSTSDANGNTSTTLNVGNITASTTVVACLASGGVCPQFLVQPVSVSNLKLQMIAGDGQILVAGSPVQPVVLRVTDSAAPSNPVAGEVVLFSETVFPNIGIPTCLAPEGICRPIDPKILYNSSTSVVSDTHGLVNFLPVSQARWGAAYIFLSVSVGNATVPTVQIRLLGPH